MSNDELEMLLDQKAKLDSRTDLTTEQKQKLARTLRRKIRQLGGTCRVLSANDTADPKEKTPRQPRASRFTKKVRPAQQLALQEYAKKIILELQELGLEKASKESIINQYTYGYSIPLMHQKNILANELVDKFKHRWASHSPKYFYTDEGETKEYILLGPIPYQNPLSG